MKLYIALCGAGKDATTVCGWLAEQKDKYEIVYQYLAKPNETKKLNEQVFREIKDSQANFIILNYFTPNYGLVRLCLGDKDLSYVPLLVLFRNPDEGFVEVYAQVGNVHVSLFPESSEELCDTIDKILAKMLAEA